MENGLKLFRTKYDLLEPWIQWVSVYAGKTATEHKIFRLGMFIVMLSKYMKNRKKRFSVGAILPMNLRNNLKNQNFLFQSVDKN